MGFLFGLAPSGVYPANIVTDAAVRSYRTFSPLPIFRQYSDLKSRWYLFCGTFRRLAPPRCYLALCSRSPDFPPVAMPETSTSDYPIHSLPMLILLDLIQFTSLFGEYCAPYVQLIFLDEKTSSINRSVAVGKFNSAKQGDQAFP